MEKENSIRLYNIAYDYLNEIIKKDKRLINVDLESYFRVEKPDSLETVFERFIQSAQNYQRMPNVIKLKQRQEEIRKILCGYDIKKISNISENDLYFRFRETFNIKTKDSKRNSWYKWSCSIVDSAKFLNRFKDLNAFNSFVSGFDFSIDSRMALPLLIQARIRGIGFALACDVLKELGYFNYSKPDVHMIDVFYSLGLSENNPFSTFEAISKMAEDCQTVDKCITPYKVDKVFWLICSGTFYNEMPDGIEIGSHKKELINVLLRNGFLYR